MTLLERHLADREYVAGPSLTMGDVPIGATVHRWFAMDIERPALPNLAAYYERLGERPSYKETVMLPVT